MGRAGCPVPHRACLDRLRCLNAAIEPAALPLDHSAFAPSALTLDKLATIRLTSLRHEARIRDTCVHATKSVCQAANVCSCPAQPHWPRHTFCFLGRSRQYRAYKNTTSYPTPWSRRRGRWGGEGARGRAGVIILQRRREHLTPEQVYPDEQTHDEDWRGCA